MEAAIAITGAEFVSAFNEEQLQELLERYRSFGPLPGVLLPFLKSFVPPLPTLFIIAWNAAVYGLWLGFLYSWIGLVGGCIAAFLLVRRIAGHRLMDRWMTKPKVVRGLQWVRRNAFSYVFLLSLFPLGPFVVINIAAGIARIKLRTFALALASGKAVMVFAVSWLGYEPSRYVENPAQLLYLLLFAIVSWIAGRKVEARYSR